MSDATLLPFGLGNLPVGCERKDASVNTASLVPELLTALAKLGRLHLDLFNKPLVITSGNDGTHKVGSKHGVNKAVDVRMSDKTAEEQIVWLTVILHMEPQLKLMMFDERESSGQDHIHLETAD